MKTTNVLSTTVVTAATAVVATVAVAAASCSLISGLRNGSYNPFNVGLNEKTLASKNSMSNLIAAQDAQTKVNALLNVSKLKSAEEAAEEAAKKAEEAKKAEGTAEEATKETTKKATEEAAEKAEEVTKLKDERTRINALTLESANKALTDAKNKKSDKREEKEANKAAVKAAKADVKLVKEIMAEAKALGVEVKESTTVEDAVKSIGEKVTELSGKTLGGVVEALKQAEQPAKETK